jgi:hypothetical protein
MCFVAQEGMKHSILGRVLQEEADSEAQAFPSPHLGR